MQNCPDIVITILNSIFVSLCICICLFLSICLFIFSPIHIFVYLSINLFVYSSMCPFVFLSIFLFVYFYIHLFVYLSIYLFVFIFFVFLSSWFFTFCPFIHQYILQESRIAFYSKKWQQVSDWVSVSNPMSESLTKLLARQLKTLCCPKIEIQWLQQDNEIVILIN